MEKFQNSLEEVVSCIKNSKEYKIVIELKNKMSTNEEINSLVREIKIKQKKYIKSNDSNIKDELDQLEKRLDEIPIYHIYLENLEKVNEMINYVKDELNQYFDILLN